MKNSYHLLASVFAKSKSTCHHLLASVLEKLKSTCHHLLASVFEKSKSTCQQRLNKILHHDSHKLPLSSNEIFSDFLNLELMQMMVMKNKPILKLIYLFGALCLITVSCVRTSKRPTVNQTSEKKVDSKGGTTKVGDQEISCFTSSDLELPDTNGLLPIVKSVFQIEEVQAFSKRENNAIFCIYETDTNDVYQPNSYFVRVGIDGEDHYSFWMNFFINKSSNEIKILEVVSDSLLTIEEWRKCDQYKNHH